MNTKGQSVRGSRQYLGKGKGSNVYLYKAAFASREQLYFTMGHEYLHAGYFKTGLMNSKKQHASIYKWEAQQAKLWGFNEVGYSKRSVTYKQYNNASYDYKKLGFYLLNIKPW